MKTERLEAVAAHSAKTLKSLIAESADEIREAIDTAYEEAQVHDKNTVSITLNHQIKLDLTEEIQNDSLTWSVKHKVEQESTMPNPDQTEMDFGDEKGGAE